MTIITKEKQSAIFEGKKPTTKVTIGVTRRSD